MIHQFLKKYSIFSLVVAIISLYPFYIVSKNGLFTGILLNFFLFYALVLLSVLIVVKSFRNKTKLFFPYLAYTIGLKMIIGLAYFVLIFRHYEKSSLTIFVFSFFLYYLIFSIFEVSFLVRQLKGQRQPEASDSN